MPDTSFEALHRAHRLTRREIEVLDLIATGHTNVAAGAQLGISPRTVEVYRARCMDKLGAHTPAILGLLVGMLSSQYPDAFPRSAGYLPQPRLPLFP